MRQLNDNGHRSVDKQHCLMRRHLWEQLRRLSSCIEVFLNASLQSIPEPRGSTTGADPERSVFRGNWITRPTGPQRPGTEAAQSRT